MFAYYRIAEELLSILIVAGLLLATKLGTVI